MLSKCANPECCKPFQYLRDGRLYEVEVGPGGELHIRAASGHPLPDVEVSRAHGSADAGGPQLVVNGRETRRLEYFWLCDACSLKMTLGHGAGGQLEIVPVPHRRAAAS